MLIYLVGAVIIVLVFLFAYWLAVGGPGVGRRSRR
jgi:hypothetical protein